VGVTRAKKRVYLLYADHRNLFGASGGTQPSRFIGDIPKHLLITQYYGDSQYGEEGYVSVADTLARSSRSADRQTYGKQKLSDIVHEKPQPAPKPSISVSPGDRVLHKIFGEGQVINCTKSNDDMQVTVNFDGAGVKRLLLSYANLEKV